jgi:RsiW-degrading membrane proteinase PrsW (M82 family)
MLDPTWSQYGIIITLVLISGVFYISKIRSYDQYDPEPIWKLVIATSIGGAISVLLALTLYDHLPQLGGVLQMFLIVGPVEELSKFIAFLAVLYLLKRKVIESQDGIIYMACAALGFSLIENVFYTVDSGFFTLALRTVVCVVGHMAFSVYMGLAYYIHVKKQRNYLGLLMALLISSAAHGLYNSLIIASGSSFAVFPVWIGLVGYQLLVVRFSLSKSEFRNDFSHFLFTTEAQMVSTTCIHCKHSITNNLHTYKGIEIVNCSNCDASVSRVSSWEKMMAEFRPLIEWKQYVQAHDTYNKPRVAFNKQKTIVLDNTKQTVGYKEKELIQWFREGNISDQNRVLDKFGIGTLLRLIGAKRSN